MPRKTKEDLEKKATKNNLNSKASAKATVKSKATGHAKSSTKSKDISEVVDRLKAANSKVAKTPKSDTTKPKAISKVVEKLKIKNSNLSEKTDTKIATKNKAISKVVEKFKSKNTPNKVKIDSNIVEKPKAKNTVSKAKVTSKSQEKPISKTVAKSKIVAKTEEKPKAKSTAKSKTVAKAEEKPKAKPTAKSKTVAKAEEKPKAKPTAKSKTVAKAEEKPKAKSTTKSKTVPKAEEKPKAKSTAKSKTVAVTKVVGKSKTKPVAAGKKKTRIITKKKVSKNIDVIEYYDLPYRYNKTIVKILAQTPNTLFVYWDISDQDSKNFTLHYGEEFFNNTKPVLIVHNKTKNYSFEIEINDFANSWYFNVNDEKCEYVVELGRRSKEQKIYLPNDYLYITSSNIIESPNDHILFEKDQKVIYFRNVVTNIEFSEDIASLNFLRYMGKIYNIYEMYHKIYADEEILDINNPSSSNPTSRFKF